MIRSRTGLVIALALFSFTTAFDARSQEATSPVTKVYGKLPADQAEQLASGDRIKSIAASGAPMAIWETLERGERVECLDCIPSVEPLLFNSDSRTREIAAWWLRRRIFGVFGKGEVFARTIQVLKTDADPLRRMYAANALGEFLTAGSIAPCKAAVTGDPDARVRAAAATALGRLNDDGKGALGTAIGDGDATVRIAALSAAGRVNGFTDVAAVAARTGDPEATVRRRAIELLGSMRARDSVASVTVLAQNDPDANVRAAACHTLGALQDLSARAALESIAVNDTDRFVRDQASIALRRL